MSSMVMEAEQTLRSQPANSAPAPAAPRPELYTAVHKGLRAFMSETLAAVGRMDADDRAEVAEVLVMVRLLLWTCRDHLALENRHLHPAMEARSPGSSRTTATDHVDHERAFAALKSDVQALEQALPARRAAAALHLYRQLAVFVAENFLHMHTEETENTALLWQTHTDAELVDLHQRIVKSIPPTDMAVYLRWMVPAMSPSERAAMLGNMRQGMPAETFAGVIATVRPHLREREWDKLSRALAAA
jgi:hypothetical protein